jgi:hypothetical protein
MADLAKVKRNVNKMVGMNAPEADIDAYIASEGVTVDDVRNFTGDASAPTVNMSVTDAFARKTKVPPPAPERPNLLNSAAATVNGLVAAVPGLQTASDAILGAGGMLLGKDYGETVQGLQQGRERIAKAAPLARAAGEIAPLFVAPAMAPKTFGLTGTMGQRLGNAAMSMAGYEGLKSIGEGEQAPETLTKMGIGGASGAAGALIGRGVEKVGEGISSAVTNTAQRGVTKAAVQGAPTGAELKGLGSQMFEQSRASGVMVDRPAFDRLWKGVEGAVGRFRPNAQLDPKAMGALQVLQDTYQSIMRPGSNVLPDLQDLHILRQAAQKAAISAEGRDAMIAGKIIDQIDDFVRTLKPGDMAGGADPRAAANALLEGISTWAKAGKVSLLEEAVRVGEVAASGPQNGIANAFRAIIKNPAMFNQFNEAEKRAIREVANGTAMSEILRFLGKGGIGSGGNSWLGAVISTVLGASSGFGPWGAGAALALGSVARKGSEVATRGSAETAMRAAATSNIPVVPQMPNLLAPARLPVDILVRGGVPAMASNGR